MPTDVAKQEPLALAGAVLRPAHAHVVHRSQPQAMQRETATADLAGDFAEGVVARRTAGGDAERTDAVTVRRIHQSDRSSRLWLSFIQKGSLSQLSSLRRTRQL